jgi:hypothetical protein
MIEAGMTDALIVVVPEGDIITRLRLRCLFALGIYQMIPIDAGSGPCGDSLCLDTALQIAPLHECCTPCVTSAEATCMQIHLDLAAVVVVSQLPDSDLRNIGMLDAALRRDYISLRKTTTCTTKKKQ